MYIMYLFTKNGVVACIHLFIMILSWIGKNLHKHISMVDVI